MKILFSFVCLQNLQVAAFGFKFRASNVKNLGNIYYCFKKTVFNIFLGDMENPFYQNAVK